MENNKIDRNSHGGMSNRTIGTQCYGSNKTKGIQSSARNFILARKILGLGWWEDGGNWKCFISWGLDGLPVTALAGWTIIFLRITSGSNPSPRYIAYVVQGETWSKVFMEQLTQPPPPPRFRRVPGTRIFCFFVDIWLACWCKFVVSRAHGGRAGDRHLVIQRMPWRKNFYERNENEKKSL